MRELIEGVTKIKWAGVEEPTVPYSLWEHKQGTYTGTVAGCLWWKSPDGVDFCYGDRFNFWKDKDFEFVDEEDVDNKESTMYIKEPTKSEWTDKHYDHYYTLTPEDIATGKIKIDPYFVNTIWGINDADKTGAAFHNLKTLSRMAKNKNSLAREWDAMIGQSTRARQLMKGE